MTCQNKRTSNTKTYLKAIKNFKQTFYDEQKQSSADFTYFLI